MEILSIVNELIPSYKKIISGPYAIALAGAHAKGKADAHSDLDIFIYAEDILPFEDRKAVFEAISPAAVELWVSDDIVSFPWGGSIDKKLEQQLKGLPFCPPILADNMEFLLTARKDTGHLNRQRDILTEAAAESGRYMDELEKNVVRA